MGKIVQQIEEEISCESSMDISKVADREIDDDGRSKRTGTVWTASAHIITAIVGSGVLSLAWGIAQLGWITGVATLLIFSAISLYTAGLLADCYRAPHSGKRLLIWGGCQMLLRWKQVQGLAIRRSNCFHKEGHGAPCKLSNNQYMIAIGIVEILLSQIPNFHKLSWLSTVAAIMSFSYSGIGMGLAFVKIVSGQAEKTILTGVEIGLDLTPAEKIWRIFRALGDMTFACAYSPILIEIQNTLRSSPPENKVMKKANVIATFAATTLNMVCGCLGYAALGNHEPGNMLTGFRFYEPFWLIDLANFFIVVHLMGAYQVVSQTVFSSVESRASMMWPNSKFIGHEYPLNISKTKLMFSVNLFRLSWRTIFVVMATVISMALQFFNGVLALLGAIGYWPLTVYFPLEMYIVRKNVKRGSIKWLSLQLLNLVCLLAAMAIGRSMWLHSRFEPGCPYLQALQVPLIKMFVTV
ncbi:hypothetical protein Patl1_12960 [Pistacia atlantica]|uniref:Uncharacterized protein n=1 Tax=Pistacia atlantica TaxID=434234 RepID=A0ACC1AUF2_9ROSI|nr:hypothetical protein Patl1_12960 [Pistacia atlantica]